MIEVKARRVTAFNKSRDDTESNQSSGASPEPEIQQKDSTLDFKAFTAEFQSQVLGIGKAPQPPQSQNRWGGAPNAPVNLSQPSNELANQTFTRIFQKALSKTCDLVVKQPAAT
jgi:hypothetical protein